MVGPPSTAEVSMSASPSPASHSPGSITSGGQFLLLLFRFLIGYGILFVCLLLLLRRPAWDLSAVDAVYWGTLLLLLVSHRRAAVAAGTREPWLGVAVWHVVVAGAIWMACHFGQAIE
jgi:hypothetical protein